MMTGPGNREFRRSLEMPDRVGCEQCARRKVGRRQEQGTGYRWMACVAVREAERATRNTAGPRLFELGSESGKIRGDPSRGPGDLSPVTSIQEDKPRDRRTRRTFPGRRTIQRGDLWRPIGYSGSRTHSSGAR